MNTTFSGYTSSRNGSMFRNASRLVLIVVFILSSIAGKAQVRDTLKLKITRQEIKAKPDTVFVFSTRIDTIALQPVKTDTSKVAKDVNPLDLNESKYRLRFMGSVRANAYYDFTGMTNTEGFMPYDIPVGEQKVDGLASIYMGARQSRLGVEGTASTTVGNIRTYIEVDFISNNESLLRLRHAYAEWNYFKLGYSWGTFMDNASLPVTVEFEGPNSSLSKRHGIIRYERKYGEKSIAGVSLESPITDYYNPSDTITTTKSKQRNFDIAARYKYLNKLGHVQVAGIFRRLEYLDHSAMNALYGWGLLFSANVNLNAKNVLFGQYSFGEGIANYYSGFAGRQLDAVYDPVSETMVLEFIRGGFMTYSYVASPLWRFSLTGGTSTIEEKDFDTPDTFRSSLYFAANAFFNPIETISLGFEVTSGSRININKQQGSSTRLSLMASFDF